MVPLITIQGIIPFVSRWMMVPILTIVITTGTIFPLFVPKVYMIYINAKVSSSIASKSNKKGTLEERSHGRTSK